MERVDSEGERDQVPGVRLLVDGLKEKKFDHFVKHLPSCSGLKQCTFFTLLFF